LAGQSEVAKTLVKFGAKVNAQSQVSKWFFSITPESEKTAADHCRRTLKKDKRKKTAGDQCKIG
jgi:hypothetical protein